MVTYGDMKGTNRDSFKQGEVIVCFLVSLALGIIIGLGWGHRSAGPSLPVGKCASEDMVPVVIADDSFNLETGATACVHVDSIDH